MNGIEFWHLLYFNHSDKWVLVPDQSEIVPISNTSHYDQCAGNYVGEIILHYTYNSVLWASLHEDTFHSLGGHYTCQLSLVSSLYCIQPLPPEDCIQPVTIVMVNIAGPCQLTTAGSLYCLNCVDKFSCLLEIFFVTIETRVATIKCLESLISCYGSWYVIYYEHCSHFNNYEVKIHSYDNGFSSVLESPVVTQGEGNPDHTIRSSKSSLRKILSEDGSSWAQYLPAIQYEFITHSQSLMRYTPTELLVGYQLHSIIENRNQRRCGPDSLHTETWDSLLEYQIAWRDTYRSEEVHRWFAVFMPHLLEYHPAIHKCVGCTGDWVLFQN